MSEVEKILKTLHNLALTVECEPHGSKNVMAAVKEAYDVLEKYKKPEKCTCTESQCENCFIDSFNGI